MSAYPDGDLDARVELLLGTWTDITQPYVMQQGGQYGTVRSGQADGAQQPTPASLALTLDNGDFRFSPRNSNGPYSGLFRQNAQARVSVASPFGTYLRLEQDNDDRAYVDDTASLRVTGSMEIRWEGCLSDWRGCVLAARWDNTVPSWFLLLNGNGTLTFSWADSANAQHTATTTEAVPYTSGITAFKVALNAPSGLLDLFVGDGIDGTYTHIGAGFALAGGTTSVRAGNAPLVVGWSNSGLGGQMLGQVTGFRLYNGLSDDGGTVAADGAFSSQSPGTSSWTDSAGNTWHLAGGAEITDRDYRLHGELSSIVPTVTGNAPRTAVTVSGRMRRLQAASQPVVMSPMKRATLAQQGTLKPVSYWTLEDTGAPRAFGPAIGGQLMTAELGKVQAAADSSFEASAPLLTLNGDQLSATVDSYTATDSWAVRFLLKTGQLPETGAEASICRVQLAAGAGVTVRTVDLHVDSLNNFKIYGTNASGGSVFATTWVGPFPLDQGVWVSLEATPSGSGTQYAAVTLLPGATTGIDVTTGATGSAAGQVTQVAFNSDLFFTDTVLGHVSVQKAWTTLFALGAPLNAWRGELAADRFARVCAENGIPCRILGRPATTQQMGPQPRGNVWAVLRDCALTEQGLLFEPHWAVNGVGLRTRESMGAEQPDAVTLSFALSDLPGDLSPADDDQGFLNDVTGKLADGTSWREVLDDGSPNSVSEPEDGGRGTYAGQIPFPLNLADPSMLQANVLFYLKRVSVDEARYRQVTADLGIPGAPAADIARLRPGDRVHVKVPFPPNWLLDTEGQPVFDTEGKPVTDGSSPGLSVAGAYQSTDILQLVTGATEVFGPGRRITWDCQPATPYGVPAGEQPGGTVTPDAIEDTDGDEIADTDGNVITDTGA